MAKLLTLLNAAVLIFMFASCQEIPEVALDETSCPIGPGVNRNTVLAGTNATCRCVIVKPGNSSVARWYTKDNETVGQLDAKDNSSVLTFSYNPSDPDQTFQCRPYTTSATDVNGITYTPQFRYRYTFSEKHSGTRLEYPVSSSLQNITWQVLGNESEPVNITTCSSLHVEANCTDHFPDLYTGYTTADNLTGLEIHVPRVNETEFRIVADNGERSLITELEFYAWPTQVLCNQKYTPTYVDYTCTSGNVYPSVVPTLHRKKTEIEPTDLDLSHTKCTYGDYGSGTNGDYNVSCNWRIKMKSMLPVNIITVGMSAKLSNQTGIPDSPITDISIIQYTVPEAELVYNECPVGPRVNGAIIKRGTKATCKCELRVRQSSPGQPRWYTKDNKTVGEENESDRSSTLTVSYDALDPKPTYTCRPFTEFPGNVVPKPYSPIFSSSMPQSIVTGLQPMIIFLGVFFSGIANR